MNHISTLLKEWGLWVQVVIWVALFLMPFSYLEPKEPGSLTLYLLRASQPLALFIVFYINFLWLIPQLLKGRRVLFFGVNVVVILLLAVSVQNCIGLMMWLRQNTHESLADNSYSWTVSPRLLVRIVYNISVSAGIAAAVTFSRKYMVSENTRIAAEKAYKEAELSHLRQQMNPHFLLNTLNNIYALTAFNQEKAQEAIQELSKLLRHSLYDCQQEFVSLTDQVRFIHSYVKLMQLRLPAHVTIQEEISVGDGSTTMVAPGIFISLVENAFKHGIDSTEPCFIHINISDADGVITCLVENSYHPKGDDDQSGHGIGLKQIRQRLELTYPGQYEWDQFISQNRKTYTSKIRIYATKLHHRR